MTEQFTDTGIGTVFIEAAQVLARYGKTNLMWLWRVRAKDPTFPKPMQINGRNFWRLSDLIAWEDRRLADAS